MPWLYVAFAAKAICAGVMLWLYTSYYPNRENADIFKYYDDGKVISSVFNQDPIEFFKLVSGIGTISMETSDVLSLTKYWDRSPNLAGINDNKLIISFNAVLSLISMNSIYIHMLFASFLAFIGLTYLLKFFLKVIQHKTALIVIAVYFSPSLLFWTSAVLKEALMIFALGGLVYYSINVWKRKTNLIRFSMMLIFTCILFLSKLYVALLILPALIAFMWNYSHADGKAVLRYAVINLLFFGLFLNLTKLMDIDFLTLLVQKQSEFKCLAEWMNAGSIVYIPELTHHWTSLLKSSPFALFNTFLRPHPFDELNSLSFLAMIETTVIVFLITISFIYRLPLSHKSVNLLLFSINFAILLGLLIGWTTPVLGAIVRYRVPMMIFILVSVISIIDLKKIRIFNRLIKSTL